MKLIIFLALLMSNILAYGNPIVIGVLKFAPPFSSEGQNMHYYGFCIDLMNDICKRLNEPCEYKGTTLEKQMKELNQGAFDLTFSLRPITQANTENYLFSMPYMTSNGQFISLANKNIRSINDIKNKKIGVVEASMLKETVLGYTSKENIKEYKKVTDLVDALADKEVDAILVNAIAAKYIVSNDLYSFQLVGQPLTLGNGYGIITLKKNQELIQKINKALLQIEADGTYLAIYKKTFGI